MEYKYKKKMNKMESIPKKHLCKKKDIYVHTHTHTHTHTHYLQLQSQQKKKKKKKKSTKLPTEETYNHLRASPESPQAAA